MADIAIKQDLHDIPTDTIVKILGVIYVKEKLVSEPANQGIALPRSQRHCDNASPKQLETMLPPLPVTEDSPCFVVERLRSRR
jgi:hypothetical protein